MDTTNRILHIKNMVCPRCIKIVNKIFEDRGYKVLAVELGQVIIGTKDGLHLQNIDEELKKHDFELLTSNDGQLVERVKLLLISLLYWSKRVRWPVSLVQYLEIGTHKEFRELNHVFCSICRCSIREYFDLLRFERAKELISYNELTIPNIADQLGYGNSHELSCEFGRRLELTLSDFIKSPFKYRLPLDRLVQA